MFRRWAEERVYRKTMQIAVSELRRAARTPNALEKLQALEQAEQKLKDALWLNPEASKEGFETGLKEISHNRQETLKKQALPAVARLLEAAEKGIADRDALLQPAGELLSSLYHYLPDDPETQTLGARFRELGGQQPPYQPVTPLSDNYHKPPPGVGCVTFPGGMVIGVFLVKIIVKILGE